MDNARKAELVGKMEQNHYRQFAGHDPQPYQAMSAALEIVLAEMGWRDDAVPTMQVDNGLVAQNLATMLRRMVWQIDKLTGDSSLKVLSGLAKDLLAKYGLRGDLLRDDPKE